jgi:hypothetical protein
MMLKYAVVIERDPDTGAVGATSPDVEWVYYVGDPSESDEQMLVHFQETLVTYFSYLRDKGEPIPQPRHFAAMVETV